MGGLITTAVRFKDGVSTSFRHYTGNYFHLTFDESEFKKQMKKGCPSSRISQKRKYIHLSTKDAIKKYETEFSKTEKNYVYGNNFLAPVWYGINFYDYKNKVAFSVNEHSNILHYPTYTLMANPVMQEILKNKDKYHFSENNLNYWSHNIPSDILFDFYKFKELKNLNALYDLDGNQLDLSHVDTIEALISLFDEDKFVQNKYASLNVKFPDWTLFHGDQLNDYQQLYDYLMKENLLGKNDILVWDLFMKEKSRQYLNI